MNVMQIPRIEKVTLNIGAGKDQAKLEKGMILIKTITGIEPTKTITKKRIPAWGLRPGLPVGCMLTLRKEIAVKVLKRLLSAKSNYLLESNFDNQGNVSFGIHEYIDIPGVAYDPKIGVFGLQVCISLEKPGFRLKHRRYKKRKIPRTHVICKDEAVDFMKKNFGIDVGEKK